MIKATVSCRCGRVMTVDALAGRGAFKCPCGNRVKVEERHDRSRCAGEAPDGTACRFAVAHVTPIPLCAEHYSAVLALLARDVLEGPEHPEPDIEFKRQLAYRRLATAIKTGEGADVALCPTGSVVYFVQNGGLIKIGTSVQLEGRIRHMGLPMKAILATEPGGREREQELHERFAKYRTHGEWFEPGRELIAYIGALRDSAARVRDPKGPKYYVSSHTRPSARLG